MPIEIILGTTFILLLIIVTSCNFKYQPIIKENMTNVFTVEKIKSTQTYRTLAERKEITKCSFLTNLAVRKVITNGYYVYRNTGQIPTNVTGINLSVVSDLIEADNEKV